MNEQWSYKEDSKQTFGSIYLVATPIGNLDDMTYRAVQTLKSVSVIAAEDTRHTRKLLTHFDIHPEQLLAYHEHNKHSAGPRLIELARSGQDIALVSDAGTPAIADPGYELVLLAIEAGISVIPIPGANAALSALIASGQIAHPFVFYGFLPRENKPAQAMLEQCKRMKGLTLIFYEAPHRIVQTLKRIQAQLGNRSVSLARELTKRHEHFLRGDVMGMLQYFEANEPRGEFVVVVGPTQTGADGVDSDADDEQNWWQMLPLEKHVAHYMEQGQPQKEAMRLVAKDRGLRKRDVYQTLLGAEE